MGPEEGGIQGWLPQTTDCAKKYFCGRTLLITATIYTISDAQTEASPVHSVALASSLLTRGAASTLAELGSGAGLRQVTDMEASALSVKLRIMIPGCSFVVGKPPISPPEDKPRRAGVFSLCFTQCLILKAENSVRHTVGAVSICTMTDAVDASVAMKHTLKNGGYNEEFFLVFFLSLFTAVALGHLKSF